MCRSDIEFVEYKCKPEAKCCYNCKHCFEDESIDGNWNLFCEKSEHEEDFVLPEDGNTCEKYENAHK